MLAIPNLRNCGVVLGMASISLSAQTPVTQTGTLVAGHTDQVQLVLVAGSGPSSNRVDHFYVPNYELNGGTTPLTMEELPLDYNFRVICAANLTMQDVDRSDVTGGFVPSRPLLSHVLRRYSPVMKVWKLDAMDRIATDAWPFYTNDLYKNELFNAAKANAGINWGLNDLHWGVSGAAAGGTWANCKICNTPYVVVEGSDWAWNHESTHTHYGQMSHAGSKQMSRMDRNSEGGGLALNMTFDPTSSVWGEWIGYRGKGIENPGTYLVPCGVARVGIDKNARESFMDVAKENGYPAENRLAQRIHVYHSATDPMDSFSPTGAVLTDPANLQVNVASTSLIKIRWYVNGTELTDRRDAEILDIPALGLSAGRHQITAVAYDEVVDYAFTGNPDLDLVRNRLDELSQVRGWTVDITSGGGAAYHDMAAFDGLGTTILSEAGFNSSPAGKTALFPWTGAPAALSNPTGLAANGLRFDGSYQISGSGTIGVASGRLTALAGASSTIDSPVSFGAAIVKDGLGEVRLGANNTLAGGTIEVSQGRLSGLHPSSFGQVPAQVTLRRGAELGLNSGITLGNSTFEGFSCLWVDTASETARLGNVNFQRVGNPAEGIQFHHYFKMGTGKLAFDGASTLDHSVLVFTGDQVKSANADRKHWAQDMGRGGSYEINGSISGPGSLVAKHGGNVDVFGTLNLQGESNDPTYLDGILALMYGTRMTVHPGAVLTADVIDIDPSAVLEYNGATPLLTPIIPAHMTSTAYSEKLDFPGYFGQVCGTGDIGTQLVLRNGAIVSPGAYGQVGRQNYLAGMFIDNSAEIHWHLADTAAGNDADGLPTGWDVLKITGTLDLNGVLPSGAWTKGSTIIDEPTGEEVHINLVVNGVGASLTEMNFTGTQSRTFVIAEADQIVGFSPEKFTVSVAANSPFQGVGGDWVVSQSGNRLLLTYSYSRNDFLTAGGLLTNDVNWSKGSKPSPTNSGPGHVALPALVPSVIADMDLHLETGALVTRNENEIYEWQGDSDIVLAGGAIDYTAASPAGNNARVLRIKGTSSLDMRGGALTLWSNKTFEMFDDGAILISGGTITAGGISSNTNFSGGAMLTFAGDGGGLVSLGSSGLAFANGGYVNFLGGSSGQLVISGTDAAYYQNLWGTGRLRLDGANIGAFADRFVVTSTSLALRSHTLTYTAGPGGSISGTASQSFTSGGTGTPVVAVPGEGYNFVDWSDGRTDNPRTDANVVGNLHVTANFEFSAFEFVYTAGAHGSLTGATTQSVGYGQSGTAVTAVPDTGYRFVDWSDGSIANPRIDTNAVNDLSVTARFEILSYPLSYLAGANGTVSGATTQTIDHGGEGSPVTAVPDVGYQFVNWSDGSIANPRIDTGVTAGLSITANFAVLVYQLQYVAGANGSLTGATTQTVVYGQSGTAVTAVPSPGYHFTSWSDGSTANPRIEANASMNVLVSAVFLADGVSMKNDFDVAGGSLWVDGNWSLLAKPSATTPGFGYVAIPALVPSVVSNMDLQLDPGAVVTRLEDSVYEWQGDTDVVIAGGSWDYTAASLSGSTRRVLRLKNTSSLDLRYGNLKLWSNRNIELFNQGTIASNGGTIEAGGILIASDHTAGAILTMGPGNGQVILGSLTFNAVNPCYVDFLSGSGGQLTVANGNATYYQSLWDAGRLRIDGANAGSFTTRFTVTGTTLALDPSNPALVWYEAQTGRPLAAPSDWLADPDGDSFSLWQEYALGGSGTTFDKGLTGTLVWTGSATELQFTRRSGMNPGTCDIEFSTTLQQGSWQTIEATSVLPIAERPGFERVTLVVPEIQANGFVRLRVRILP